MSDDIHQWLSEIMDRIDKANSESQTFVRLYEDKTDSKASCTSWLGGRPCMPEDVLWPRMGGQPCRFLAQIDCSTFPADIWDGLGPRQGWLLFFCGFQGDKTEFKVIHSEKLGVETAPGSTPSSYIGQDIDSSFEAPKIYLRPVVSRDSKSFYDEADLLGVVGGRPEQTYPGLVVMDPQNLLMLELRSTPHFSWGGTYLLAITIPRKSIEDAVLKPVIVDVSN